MSTIAKPSTSETLRERNPNGGGDSKPSSTANDRNPPLRFPRFEAFPFPFRFRSSSNNMSWRTAHNMSSSSLRKKSDLSLVLKVRCGLVRDLLANLQEIFLGTKLCILFPAIPLAVAANYFHFGREWLFALSLIGLTPLAERVSFLTEIDCLLYWSNRRHHFRFQEQDITLGVSLGSATQISMFVVLLCVIVAWITGIKMDLDLNLLETGSLIMAILVIAFTLQVTCRDGTSHYLKGLVPLLCYLAIGACFFVFKSPFEHQPTSSITRTAAVTEA
ncbi:vacuolar cation/proton exchanger 1a-like [Curcuma longa]|uniref:vacuolar cation/proton exchanger 1a-like n=1 Tax=Curcuma longa TaxID=136217 RepID=UPI003D9F3901